MNAPFDLRGQALTNFSVLDETQLKKLVDDISSNESLPAPDPQSVFVGDGDYRAIGVEYLGHYIRLGGLKPSDKMLDIGCGIGRMAVPLTQYLDPESACYEGVDPVNEGIEWCVQNITSNYPHFRFCRVDIAHELYNPGGAIVGDEIVLPFGDARFDFATMVSVATHLPRNEIAAYAREILRLLVPGGRLFLTAFLVAPDDIEHPLARPKFIRGNEVGAWYADPSAPLGAIGFDVGIIEDILKSSGLEIRQVSLGHWRGIESAHYQDVIIASKPEVAG
jgi:SAM-dependent methyltransferase